MVALGDENKTIKSIKHKLIESQACVQVFRLALMEFPRAANWVKGHLSCCCFWTGETTDADGRALTQHSKVHFTTL